jgi:hypothetical protein
MTKGDVHTVPRDGSWANTIEGDERSHGSHDTKDAAVREGRELARQRQVEHVIHGQDGQIAERNSYGNDPAHRPG